MTDFFAMGGYAFYVWSSFGIAAAIILYNIVEPVLHHRKALKTADEFYLDEPEN